MRSKQIHILPVQLGQEESDQHPACRTGRVFEIQIALSKNQSIFFSVPYYYRFHPTLLNKKCHQPSSFMSLSIRLCQQEWISASRIDSVLLQFLFSPTYETSPAVILCVASYPTVSTGMDFGESHRHRFVAVFFLPRLTKRDRRKIRNNKNILFLFTHNPETRDLSFDLVKMTMIRWK